MNRLLVGAAVAVALGFAGAADAQNNKTGERNGAIAGAVGGAVVAGPVGAVVGGVGGAVIGKHSRRGHSYRCRAHHWHRGCPTARH